MQVDAGKPIPKFSTRAAEIVWQMRELTDQAFKEEQAELIELKQDMHKICQMIEECR